MKPAICGVGRWYDGCRLVIDDDGNCFGLSWMTTALVGAAQSRRHTAHFIKQLKQLMGTLKKGALGDIDSTSMVSSNGIPLPISAAHVMIDLYLV